MWRYLAGGAAALAMGGAGLLAFGGAARPGPVLPLRPAQVAAGQEAVQAPARLPEATPETREEKRFGRYDKDEDGAITREEYLANRRKAYVRLDRDGTVGCRSTSGPPRPRPSSRAPTATSRAR